MAMSRKDYKLIAKVLKEVHPREGDFGNLESYWEEIVNKLGSALSIDNSRFDFETFHEAASEE